MIVLGATTRAVAGKTILYTGDLGSPSDMDDSIDGTDLLLTELAHFPPAKLFEYLGPKSVSRVVCLHIHPDWDTKTAECLAIAKPFLGDRLTVGHDGMEIEV